MAKGKQDRPVLYRVAKFEVKPSREERFALELLSSNLREVYNRALAERQRMFDTHLAPLYQKLKETGAAEVKKRIAEAFKNHGITLFDQINALTSLREADQAFASTPRNWQEETLDTLNGAFSSFMTLRKRGDLDARPPRSRSEAHFAELVGRYGFKIDGDSFTLSAKALPNGRGRFSIPEYQQSQLTHAKAVKKFTLYRTPSALGESGTFWVSLAYEIDKPELLPFEKESAVYIALGASSFGVVSPRGEETIPLWRPDKHWVRKIEELDERIKKCVRGSRTWEERVGAKRQMYRLMSRQQTQNHREVAQKLLAHGAHFVVNEVIVRSKVGKLADARIPERRGSLGLNWQAQNTGSFAQVVAWLREKAAERGGSVRVHKLTGALPLGKGHENKIAMAYALREYFSVFGE